MIIRPHSIWSIGGNQGLMVNKARKVFFICIDRASIRKGKFKYNCTKKKKAVLHAWSGV